MRTTKLVEVEGALLAVEHEANPGAGGTPVLFLHANVADRRMWRGQWDALATATTTPKHPVISYDRRGFGESRTLRPMPYSNVSDLWAVMDSFGYEQAILVGSSMGGRIAIDAALAQPDRVAGLVIVAPGVTGAPAPQHGDAVKALMDAINTATAQGDLEKKNELQAHAWLDGPLSPAGRVGGETRELFLSMNGTALRATNPGAATEEEKEPLAWENLEAIRTPTPVMWGELDMPYLQERCKVLAQRIPGAQSLVLSGTAHLPALEAPLEFNSVLGRYLQSF